MVEEDDASWAVPAIFHESKCHCKNVIAAISAFFPRALFSRRLGHAHIFSLEPLDGQRSVITYIYMLRITYTYVMCLNVINVHNVFAQ